MSATLFLSKLSGGCLIALWLSVAALAAAGPTTEPVRLPRILDFQVAGQEPTARQAYVAVWFARRASDETSLEAARKQKAGRLLAEAEKSLRDLAVKAEKDPAAARGLGVQASQIQDKLEQDVRAAIGDAEMRHLVERIEVLFLQELLLSNGPSAFLQEEAQGSGLKLTAEQEAKLRPMLAAADAAAQASVDRLAQGGPPEPVDLEEGMGGQIAKLRLQIRTTLTPEQRQRWDQWVSKELAQMRRRG